MTDLLPCPFCGSAPILDEHPPTPGDDDSFAVIRCGKCGFSKQRNFTGDLVKWWNTRHQTTMPVYGTKPSEPGEI